MLGKRTYMRTFKTLLVFLAIAIPAVLFGQIGIRVAIGPPPLPVYEQPLCPGDGYLWTPGYWAYDDSVTDYYWVPGTWVLAPEEGYLWTPGYWGWDDGGFFFNDGYWGPEVGFYGGINYGFGYYGEGYDGGRWEHGNFFYNRSLNNIDNNNNHHVYEARVGNNAGDNRVSYNGGKGGIEARPSSQQEAVARQHHIPAVAAQTGHMQAARANPDQRVGINHGKPAIAATSRPGELSQRSAAVNESNDAAKSGAGGEEHGSHVVVHPKDLPPIARPAPIVSGNAKADRKYEQNQDKLIARQTQDRQKLQQKQDSDHQKKTNANIQKQEQVHQQQTQNMVQKHAAQQQSLQSHQPQARSAGPGPKR
jgi:hypothetical protein